MSNNVAGEVVNDRPTYFDIVEAITDRFPILFYVSHFVKRQFGQSVYPVRVTVLEFSESVVRKIDFDGSNGESGYDKLQAYLSSPSSDCQHRLYMMEDLNAAFIELLGAYLNMDGTVFASQIRDTHFSGGWEHGHQPQLPSFQDPRKSFTLRYYEARYFDDDSMPEFSASVRTTGNLSRQISFGKDRGNKVDGHEGLIRTRNYDGQVGLIRRNSSFWSRIEANGSWNGVILIDPPVRGITGGRRGNQEVRLVPNYVYQGGYRDFTPWPTSADLVLPTIRGPQHISLLDDISFYWTEVATRDQINSAILSESETKLWEIEQMISPGLSDAEKDLYLRDFTVALNEVNTMRRRLNWFIAEMKVNCEVLGTSPDCPADSSKQNGDFIAIYNRLVSYQNWAEKLMNVITTLVNLMETEKSIADSKSLARLTILGFFFIPLSFIATIFSMGGDFLVGESKFWIFFAVSIPLTFLVFVVAFGKWRSWWKEMMYLASKRQ